MEFPTYICRPPVPVLSSTPADELNMCEETALLPHASSGCDDKLSTVSILWKFLKKFETS